MRKKYRVKFKKVDKMKFIGHLDLLKIVQRSINRAKLPIAFSEGFNPHQLVSFAQPLALGHVTVGDYFDIVLVEDIDENIVINNLNKVLPIGMEVVGCKKYDALVKNSATYLIASDYTLKFPKEYNIENALSIFENEEILYTKVNKKGVEKVVDIKKDIYELKYVGDNTLFCKISSGSIKNLKVDVLIDIIGKEIGESINTRSVFATRQEMYMFDENENLVTLN